MDCREVEGLLDAYQDRELEPAVSTSVRDHVEQCAACRQRLANLESISRMIRRAPYYQAPAGLRTQVIRARARSAVTPQWLAWAAARLGGRRGPGRLPHLGYLVRQIVGAPGAHA